MARNRERHRNRTRAKGRDRARSRIWAITRVGDTSDVRKVEKQRLNALSFDQVQAKYSEIAGLLAAENF